MNDEGPAEVRPDLPPGVPEWYEEPGFIDRFIARFADHVLFLGVASLVDLAIEGRGRAAVVFVLALTYEVVATARWGRTIGKRLAGVRVADLDTGANPSPSSAFVRRVVLDAPTGIVILLPALSTLYVVLTLVIIVPILRRPLHRGLHDLAARTVVTGVPSPED